MNLIFLIPTYGNSRESRKVIKAMGFKKGGYPLGFYPHDIDPRGYYHDSS